MRASEPLVESHAHKPHRVTLVSLCRQSYLPPRHSAMAHHSDLHPEQNLLRTEKPMTVKNRKAQGTCSMREAREL